MTKKKIWLIIGIIIAIVAITVGAILIIKAKNNNSREEEKPRESGNETGSFHELTFESKDVLVIIKSTEDGHPSTDAKFATSFTIDDEEGESNYSVDYVDVEEWENNPDYKTITINKKEFSYHYRDEGYESVDLYYQIPSSNGLALHILVVGTSIYGPNGERCKCMPTITEEVLTSKELSGILNFETSLV